MKQPTQYRCIASRGISIDGILLHFIKYDIDNNKSYNASLDWHEFKGLVELEPAMILGSRQEQTFLGSPAQELMDNLWHCGIRPTEGSGTAGSMGATQEHLKDLRRIVFGLLKKHGVE